MELTNDPKQLDSEFNACMFKEMCVRHRDLALRAVDQGGAVAYNKVAVHKQFSDWAWNKEGEAVGRMDGNAAAIEAWHAAAKLYACPHDPALAERLQFLDDANTSLADENCRMRLALMDLIDAIDGCEDLDEMDGLEFNLSQERLEKAMATARPFHEKELLKDAQAAAALGASK